MLGKSLDRSLPQEDILTGNNEWLNIQEIVRVTFRSMQSTMQAQDRAIQNLERQLSLKASRSELQTLFGQKLDAEEFHVEVHNLRNVMQAIRTDTSDLICANREDYINDFRKIVAELETKPNKGEVFNQINDLDYARNLLSVEVKDLRKDVENRLMVLKSQFSQDMDYSRELNMIEFDKILEGNKAILAEVQKNKLFSDDNFQNVYQKHKALERGLEISNELHSKSEEDSRKLFNSALASNHNELTSEISLLTENQNRLAKELELLRASKADNSHMVSMLQVKSEEIQLIRQELSHQAGQVKLRALQSDLDKEAKTLRDLMDLHKKESSLKYDKKITEVHEVLSTKVAHDDHGTAMSKQEEINETLCSENTVGRWVCENKRSISGGVVWDYEKINTCPDLFSFESGSSEINVVKAGCYEVSLGFFAERPPSVQVQANGQVVYSLVNRPG